QTLRFRSVARTPAVRGAACLEIERNIIMGSSLLFTVVVVLVEIIASLAVTLVLLNVLIGLRYIPHDRVGIVEKLWSHRGSLGHGRILAIAGEAGFQARLLRGGLHL